MPPNAPDHTPDAHEFSAELTRPDLKGAWTFAPVPPAVSDAFGAKGRVPVTAAVNGVAFRTSLLPQGGGTHIIVVNKNIREQAGVDAGDRALVRVERDDQPRTVAAPPELRIALDAAPDARASYDALSYSRKKEYADYVAEAKRPQTRQRRAAKVAETLAAGKRLK